MIVREAGCSKIWTPDSKLSSELGILEFYSEYLGIYYVLLCIVVRTEISWRTTSIYRDRDQQIPGDTGPHLVKLHVEVLHQGIVGHIQGIFHGPACHDGMPSIIQHLR